MTTIDEELLNALKSCQDARTVRERVFPVEVN